LQTQKVAAVAVVWVAVVVHLVNWLVADLLAAMVAEELMMQVTMVAAAALAAATFTAV
jgi:hypothetical protein